MRGLANIDFAIDLILVHIYNTVSFHNRIYIRLGIYLELPGVANMPSKDRLTLTTCLAAMLME